MGPSWTYLRPLPFVCLFNEPNVWAYKVFPGWTQRARLRSGPENYSAHDHIDLCDHDDELGGITETFSR